MLCSTLLVALFVQFVFLVQLVHLAYLAKRSLYVPPGGPTVVTGKSLHTVSPDIKSRPASHPNSLLITPTPPSTFATDTISNDSSPANQHLIA